MPSKTKIIRMKPVNEKKSKFKFPKAVIPALQKLDLTPPCLNKKLLKINSNTPKI
jgi:hypothetical protein